MSQHKYFPHTPDDIAAMLERCQADSIDDLFSDIPADLRADGYESLSAPMSEIEVRNYFAELTAENTPLVCFAGAGYYDHYTPSVVANLLQRSEYLTAYTPYQPEISQGTLQYIFEYQSMMCQLTGMDVSNASMYDGTTATAEAMLMCVAAARKRNRVLISATVSPAVRQVVATYARYHGVQLDVIPETDGVTDRAAMQAMLADGDVAGVILASPNWYGILEDYSGFADDIHGAKALMVINSHASALGVVKSPREWGADIAVGEAQSLGMPLNYGGPTLGYMCVTKALMRKMPGRIVGATVDKDGQRVFVLTLQAREQHIRREKATSNICSNQGLMTLFAAMYCSLMGAKGLREVNELGYGAAHYLADQLVQTGAVSLKYADRPFLNEFVVKCNGTLKAADIIDAAAAQGYLAGVALADDELMIAVTETRTRLQIDTLVEIVKEAAAASAKKGGEEK